MKLDQALEEKIVSSIATMDRRMLEVLLPDNGVYDGTYKEVWLSKLYAMYEECLDAGDKSFRVIERLCTDVDDLLHGQKVHVFCALGTKWCLMVVFVVKDGNIIGLQQYRDFNLVKKEKIFNPTHVIKVGLDIYDNERIGYVESEEHKAHKLALVDFEKDMKNDRRKVIGRKWLLMMIQKYNWLYQRTVIDYHCEEVARFNIMITDFYNLYSFMRKPGGYVSLYTKYKALAGKEDKTSVLKRRKLIADNMLTLFSFYTSRNFGMNDNQDFTYSYTLDKKSYSAKLHLRDTRIEVAGYFPFIKESQDVISHFFDAYKRDFPSELQVYSIDDVVDYYKGKMEEILLGMDE